MIDLDPFVSHTISVYNLPDTRFQNNGEITFNSVVFSTDDSSSNGNDGDNGDSGGSDGTGDSGSDSRESCLYQLKVNFLTTNSQ
jgi:hypothetical protein